MNQGVKTVIYPVSNITQAKALYRALLGVEPYADTAYYVGFKAGDQDIGLDPHGHKAGVTAYHHVDDVQKTLQALLDAGAQLQEDVRDVGGGTLIAAVKDADGNIIGLRQLPS